MLFWHNGSQINTGWNAAYTAQYILYFKYSRFLSRLFMHAVIPQCNAQRTQRRCSEAKQFKINCGWWWSISGWENIWPGCARSTWRSGLDFLWSSSLCCCFNVDLCHYSRSYVAFVVNQLWKVTAPGRNSRKRKSTNSHAQNKFNMRPDAVWSSFFFFFLLIVSWIQTKNLRIFVLTVGCRFSVSGY